MKGVIHLFLGAVTIAIIVIIAYVVLVNIAPGTEQKVLDPISHLRNAVVGY
jgi:hypothetical protein